VSPHSFDQTSQVLGAIRVWFDSMNAARATGDEIAAARANKASQAVAEWATHVQRGHARVQDRAAPLLVVVFALLALTGHVAPLYAARRPLALELVRTIRKLEETAREMFNEAAMDGGPVAARSTAFDAKEDQALGAAEVKLVLS
jgi:hypothetical protein